MSAEIKKVKDLMLVIRPGLFQWINEAYNAQRSLEKIISAGEFILNTFERECKDDYKK